MSRSWYLEVLLGSQAVDAPPWLFVGAVVYDTDRRRWGKVVDLGFPRDRRQLDRAWLRPLPGGREWNPRFAVLSPTAPSDHAHPRDGGSR